MDKTRKRNLLRPGIFGLSVVALGALAALVIAWWPGSAQPASADLPHAGIDLSVGVGSSCDSSAGPAKCTLNPGDTFTLNLKVSAIPGGFSYAAYDSSIDFTGVTLVAGSLVQTGAGVWPSCAFPASDLSVDGHIQAGCALGIGAAASTYTGVVMHADFECASSGTITLVSGIGATSLLDDALAAHGEVGSEVITINCGAAPPPPTVMPTPCDGPCPTATPTNTPTATNTPGQPTSTRVPPTATRTPSGPPPTPTQGAVAPTATALPVLAKTGSGGGLDQSSGNGRTALWLAVASLLGLTGASLTVLPWMFARNRQ